MKDPPMPDECHHLKALVRGTDDWGRVYCPDCEKTIFVADILNEWLDALRPHVKAAVEKDDA